MPEQHLVVGDDGYARCWWGSEPDIYRRYHDTEWGFAVTDDHRLFEKISLEGFQAGLSWLTILRKRPAMRAAFAEFDPACIAAFDERDIARLLGDAGLVRHRGKIEAAVTNARATAGLVEREGDGALDRLFWSFAPTVEAGRAPVTLAEVPTRTPESAALAKALKAAGFVFVGPTTMYAAMQACGVVNDHLAGCYLRG